MYGYLLLLFFWLHYLFIRKIVHWFHWLIKLRQCTMIVSSSDQLHLANLCSTSAGLAQSAWIPSAALGLFGWSISCYQYILLFTLLWMHQTDWMIVVIVGGGGGGCCGSNLLHPPGKTRRFARRALRQFYFFVVVVGALCSGVSEHKLEREQNNLCCGCFCWYYYNIIIEWYRLIIIIVDNYGSGIDGVVWGRDRERERVVEWVKLIFFCIPLEWL